VTTNSFEIADFAAMHKRKLRAPPIQRQSVSFAQQLRGQRLRFANRRLDR
jgi:hypothetical protein